VTEVLLGGAWAILVVAWAWRSRPAPTRARVLTSRPARRRARPSPNPVRRLGHAIRSRLGRTADPAADARVGAVVLIGLVCLPFSPLLSATAAIAAWSIGAVRVRQGRQRARERVREGLPEVVDLFVVGVGAGLNVPLALRAIGPLCPPPFDDALRDTVARTDMGTRTADALERLPETLGESVRPLASALIAAERYGVPLTASLERLADEVRRDRRRHAEAAARRVPVKLLFPLVFCSLPALALLSVAPLVAGALRALRT